MMGHWRSKILFGLIVYFGGFATAIYYLAPVSQDASGRAKSQIGFNWPFKTDVDAEKVKEVAGQFQEKVKHVVSLAEDQAKKVAEIYQSSASQADKN